MLPDLTINNKIWLVMTIISFIGGQLCLFGTLLGWMDQIDHDYKK